jgi:anti-anti-sigma factor
MEIKVISADEANFTHLALCGKMDNQGVIEIEEQFLALTVGRGVGAVIDISEVTFMGSNGLRLFLRAVKGLRPLKKVVILLNPRPLLHEILLDSGIQEAVAIEHNTESAIRRAQA